jgi:hypothetical protein
MEFPRVPMDMKLLAAATALPVAAQEYYDIDVDLPQYPEMLPVPESPVYYAPSVDSNYFFYDGQYWDFYNDGWYTSPWYNGPWVYVDPVYVPTYVLWVPIRYYRRPPYYFRSWHRDRPPRWSERWGHDWQRNHNAVYAGNRGANVRAPLPEYQRNFNRNNYPRGADQQASLHAQNYGYRSRFQTQPLPPHLFQQQPQQPQQQPANPVSRGSNDGRGGGGDRGDRGDRGGDRGDRGGRGGEGRR